jgi:hypothetical protein
VRLLEAEPDFGRFLTDDDRRELRALTLPVLHLARGETEIAASRVDRQAFGVLVLDGMLLQRLAVAGHEGMRLIGPGDVLAVEEPRLSTVVSACGRRAGADTRLAVLGGDFLNAARRWPALIAGLHARSAEQAERISAQLAICQLPRVTDRLLATMWMLAETWGRVTPAGVTLPLALTHGAFGALVGARRPTVSLAMAELAERGAIVRQRASWLLLERPPESAPGDVPADDPILLERDPSPWYEPPAPPPPQLGVELIDTVHRLRDELLQARSEVDSTLAEAKRLRERARVGRARRAQQPINRRRAPSSG